jgi:hypothetical protein
MSEIDANPAPRPPSVYEAEHPGSSLAIGGTALAVQLGSFPFVFLFGVMFHRNLIGTVVETVLAMILLLLPLAGILGIRAGVAHLARSPGSLAAWTGIVFNTVYILFGLLLCLLAFSD